MKKTITFIFLIISISVFSQKKNVTYHNISQHYLIVFKNDSIVNFSEFPRHMSKVFSKDIKYLKKNDEIEINLNCFYDFEKKKFNLSNSEKLILKKEKGLLINDDNKMLFSIYQGKKPYYTTFLIDGKEYKLENYRSNSYGLLEKTPKGNPELDKILKTIGKNEKKYDIKSYNGYEAYKKYGKDFINGIIVIYNK